MMIARTIGFSSGAKLPPILASIAGSGAPSAPTVTTVATTAPTHVPIVPELNKLTFVGTFSGTTSRRFEHADTEAAVNAGSGIQASITNSQTTYELTGLTDSKTKYYRAVGINNLYTQTIAGTINPNYFSTQVTVVRSLNSDMSSPIDTTNVGTFAGSTPQSFTCTFISQTAGTTYYYRVTATNAGGTHIVNGSYIVQPTVTNSSTVLSATTVAAQTTPVVIWEASSYSYNDTYKQGYQFRLRVDTVANNSYQLQKWNGASYVFQENLFVSGAYHYTNFFWASTAVGATTTSTYRIVATDNYSRVKNVNKTVAPVRQSWGYNAGAGFVEDVHSALLEAQSTGIMNQAGETLGFTNAPPYGNSGGMVTIAGTAISWDTVNPPAGTRHYIESYRVYGEAKNGVYNAFASYRRIRFFANGVWTGRQSGMENGTTSANSGWISNVVNWSTGAHYYLAGDDVATNCGRGLYKYGTCASGKEVEWGYVISGITRATDVTVYVRYYVQNFANTSANSTIITT